MKRIFSLLLCLTLLCCCAACSGAAAESGQVQVRLYYAVGGRSQTKKGLIDFITLTLPQEELAPEPLVQRLLEEPAGEGLYSPYPSGTRLISAVQNGSKVQVCMSPVYGELSGLGETIADYCIVLNLCQLDGVESVNIRIENGEEKYDLRPEDVILGDG